jgi:hypothetical protein
MAVDNPPQGDARTEASEQAGPEFKSHPDVQVLVKSMSLKLSPRNHGRHLPARVGHLQGRCVRPPARRLTPRRAASPEGREAQGRATSHRNSGRARRRRPGPLPGAVAAATGLRQGEVFGLTLDRVDFLRRLRRVDRQLVGLSGREPRFGPPRRSPASAPSHSFPLSSRRTCRRFPRGADGRVFTGSEGQRSAGRRSGRCGAKRPRRRRT